MARQHILWYRSPITTSACVRTKHCPVLSSHKTTAATVQDSSIGLENAVASGVIAMLDAALSSLTWPNMAGKGSLLG